MAYSLTIRTVRTQQPTITRQRPVHNRRIVFSEQSMPMAGHAIMEYVMPSLSNNQTETEERCFLRGPHRVAVK
jgi:hypothetical protein